MSRRYPGAGPRSAVHTGTGAARHRWAGLGESRQDALLGAGPAATTLDEATPAAAALDGGAPAGLPAPRTRWRTGRRAAALLAVISVLLGGWFWWQAGDGAPTVRPLDEPAGAEAGGLDGTGANGLGEPAGGGKARAGGQDAASDPAAGQQPGTGPGGTIVVHIAGAVVSPGVVELPAGSRLHEAIKAAGGSTATADTDRLNLAAILEDGQKILVQERGSTDAAATDAGTEGPEGSAGPAPPAASKVNLNTAGIEELATLPRVGPVLAQRIVDWRKQHGRFSSVQELDAVDGVGPKLLEALLPLVRV